jgi:hypothetical protein
MAEDSFDSTDSSNDTDEPGEKELYLQPRQTQVQIMCMETDLHVAGAASFYWIRELEP